MKVAILVDGGFYRRRALLLFGEKKAEDRAKELVEYAMRHLRQDKKDIQEELSLYRIFYYDCPPMNKKLYHPLLKKQIDYGKSELYTWMTIFLDALKENQEVAGSSPSGRARNNRIRQPFCGGLCGYFFA